MSAPESEPQVNRVGEQVYPLVDRENDVATFITISNIAERMSTIALGVPSAFCFSSFELRCIKLAVVEFGRALLTKLEKEEPTE